MGYTDSTARLNLPQYIGTDSPDWLTDINQAFETLDEAYGATKESAVNAEESVSQMSQQVTQFSNDLTALTDTVDCIKATTKNNVADINNLNTLVENVKEMLTVVQHDITLSMQALQADVYFAFSSKITEIQGFVQLKASYNQVAYTNECGVMLFSVTANPYNLTATAEPAGFVRVGTVWVENTAYYLGAIYNGTQTQLFLTWPSSGTGPAGSSVVRINNTWFV